MPENNNSNYNSPMTNRYCNNLANQYLFLATIYSAIISEEIEDDEVLGLLGSFLIVLGEQVSLASEARIFCKSQFEDDDSENNLEADTNIAVEDIFDRSYKNNNKKPINKKVYKKIKRKRRIKPKKGL